MKGILYFIYHLVLYYPSKCEISKIILLYHTTGYWFTDIFFIKYRLYIYIGGYNILSENKTSQDTNNNFYILYKFAVKI